MKSISHEIKHHIPFAVFSAVMAIVIIAFFTIALGAIVDLEDHEAETDHEHDEHEHSHEGAVGPLGEKLSSLFHIFHPLHVLFSATATTAMFWRFDKKLSKAVVIGFLGSIGIGTMSDVLFPYLGGMAMGVPMVFHAGIIEDPLTILTFAAIGVGLGLIMADIFFDRRSTQMSHSGHVFISTMASLLYLVTFGYTGWMENLAFVFILLILAVLIPCNISDVIFPLLFVNRKHAERFSACTEECEEDEKTERIPHSHATQEKEEDQH